jgi:hypothetical protein
VAWTSALHWDGYQPTKDQTTAQFFVSGDADEPFTARTELLADITYLLSNGHWLQEIEVGPLIAYANGLYWWQATVTWGIQSSGNPDTSPGIPPTLRFSTKGGTQHITQSLETVDTYSRPAPLLAAPDFKGAIGVTRGGIQGVDIVVPAFSWSLSIRVAASSVNDAYVMNLESLTGCVNDDTYYGRAAGEVRFDGAEGQRTGDEMELTFSFSSQRNVEDRTIGDIDMIDKEGWDYLWVQYEDEEDDTAKAMSKVPNGVYIERVSPRADFALLGI